MLVLGIDPGSINTGWALLESHGNKTSYIASGVLSFDKNTEFLERLSEIKVKVKSLLKDIKPNEIALESLIFVKSPTSLIKLAQTRGIIIGEIIDGQYGKIFEYSPNLVKSSAVGHGHANKESVRKVIDMMFGKRDYKTHDETDAVAIALCHILNKGKSSQVKHPLKKKSSGKGLAGALAHKIGK